jgi:phage terminase large subunit-like protein
LAQQPPPRTRSGLLPDAAQLVLPAGIASTSFPAAEATCRTIGIGFDPWQVDLNRCILGKTADGLYAADTVALSIPRQVGKTYDVGGLVFADSIIHPGSTTVWTAHRFKVARESFTEMRAWAKSPRLRQHIEYDDITTAAGNEVIPFRNGSRIVFAARERGAIRGFTKVRRLVLDEAQILTDAALADLAPTMNQAANPQILLMGTPPKPTDPGEVFTRLRGEALAGTSEGLLYVEFAAPAGSDPLDRAAWRKANPSYPARTPGKAILRLHKLLSPEDFLREALGIWDERTSDANAFLAEWLDCADPESAATGAPVFGIDVSPGSRSASIFAATTLPDGRPHLELVDHRAGIRWVASRCAELLRNDPAGWALDPGGPAGVLLPALADVGIDPRKLTTRELGRACEMLTEEARAGELAHLGDPIVTEAIRGAGRRDIGDGMWAWSRRQSEVDISPLYAATVARWGLAALEPAKQVPPSPVTESATAAPTHSEPTVFTMGF